MKFALRHADIRIQAERVWLDAMKEYEADRYEAAAKKFLDAANLFYTDRKSVV